jgi:hypothetical protein
MADRRASELDHPHTALDQTPSHQTLASKGRGRTVGAVGPIEPQSFLALAGEISRFGHRALHGISQLEVRDRALNRVGTTGRIEVLSI